MKRTIGTIECIRSTVRKYANHYVYIKSCSIAEQTLMIVIQRNAVKIMNLEPKSDEGNRVYILVR